MLKKMLLVFMFFALPVFAQSSKWNDLQKNIDSWLDGPPSLLLTSQEKDVYKKLKTPEDKMQFIKIFWQRRDPILRTSENEFKTEFYNRVDYVNKTFLENNVPGWKTARGQVYVLFGPPSRIDHQTVPGSSRPAQLWIFDKVPSHVLPPNEAMMFIYRDFKYVLAPPDPQPGDHIAEQQQQFDRNFRYQDIPSLVTQAFDDIREKQVIDEKKNYDQLLFSVKSTEKFAIADIPFDLTDKGGQVEVTLAKDKIPVYDDGEKSFAELSIKQELKQGDNTVATSEETKSYTWAPGEFEKMQDLNVSLKRPAAPAGTYELWVTVQDRISMISETKKIPVNN